MQQVLFIDNPLDRSSWETVEVEDARVAIMSRFASWPPTARIYASHQPAKTTDVTPRTDDDIERLASFEKLAVVVEPNDPVTLIVAIAAVVISLASFFMLPKINAENVQTTSSNNGLSERTNRARPNARIPDIFGQVLSIPDLIAVPYRTYTEHRQTEIAYMCIGRGGYEVERVRDGDTLIENIDGASVQVYGPFDSPNGGDTPQLTIGSPIGDPVFSVSRLNEVNGQVLKAPNDTSVRADAQISFLDGGIIQAASGSGIDFTEFFEPDDDIELGNTDTSGRTAPVVIFVAATAAEVSSGVYGKLVFTGYDPRDDFEVDQKVRLAQAVWVTTTGGGGGDLGGGTAGGGGDNPDFPTDQFPEPIE